MNRFTLLIATFALVASVAVANADVVISSGETENMTCSAGVCAPTAADAVLNTGDLEALLASGNVSVVTTNGSLQADNIDVTSGVTWFTTSSLTLDAYLSVSFAAAVQVEDPVVVSLITNDGGNGGSLFFADGGELGFSDLRATLLIDGKNYTLVGNLKALAEDIVRKPSGFFALARDCDASQDGVYYEPPIPVPFTGTVDGLGQAISNVEIVDESDDQPVGLFAVVKKSGILTNVRIDDAIVRGSSTFVGAIVGVNEGTIFNASSSGTVSGSHYSHSNTAGGLVGENKGTIALSRSSVSVRAPQAGGLTGGNSGTISQSFSTGAVMGDGFGGGFAGGNSGSIEDTYATGAVGVRARGAVAGGFAGGNFSVITTSYSAGLVSAMGKKQVAGGFLGYQDGTVSDDYWNTTTSGQDQGSGDGNDTGLTGLTTEQFQSGLPTGFDPTIWAESADINNGLPYLINNPPRK